MRTFICALLWAIFGLLTIDQAHAIQATYQWEVQGEPTLTGSDGSSTCSAWWGKYRQGYANPGPSQTPSGMWLYNKGFRATSTTSGYCWQQVYYDQGMKTPNGSETYYTFVQQKTTGVTCPYGGSPDGTGNCPEPSMCKPGYALDATGRCVYAPNPNKECPDGYYVMAYAYAEDPNVVPQKQPVCAKIPDPCPKGYQNIGSGSNPVCAPTTPLPDNTKPTTNTTTKQPTTTTQNPDGSTTTTEKTVTKNSDGSSTTTTTTTKTNADGTTTTETTRQTSAAPNGLPGVNDSATVGTAKDAAEGKSQEKETDLCKLHPGLSICQNSSIGDACGSFTCSGDAIQCSIARQQQQANCDRLKAETDMQASDSYKKGSALLSGNDPDSSSLPSKDKASSVALSSSTFNSSGWMGGGACFPDKTVSFRGQTITISFTKACEPLIAFRYALMVVAMLLSFRMLSSTILKD